MMHRYWVVVGLEAAVLSFGALGAGGCEVEGVGDPCMPEEVPAGGFDPNEAYLETSSVQCRTRVCMVYKLRGDPNQLCGDPDANTEQCAMPDEVDKRIYCTCRCRAPDDSTATVCECPDGYSCSEVLKLGGAGITGSYCVKSTTIESEE